MADEIDKGQAHIEQVEAHTIAEVRLRAANIPKGVEGDCELCGEHSLRLVNRNCARCRDKFKLP